MATEAPKTKAPARSKSELFVEKAAKLRGDILAKLDDLKALAKYNAHTPAHVDAIFDPIAKRLESAEEAFKAPPSDDELPPLVAVVAPTADDAKK